MKLDLADALEGWKPRWPRALRGCGGLSGAAPVGRRRPRRIFCKLKICPECSVRAQKKNFAKFRPRAIEVMGPNGVAAFVTLTDRHGEHLQIRAEQMLKAIRSLLNRQVWKRPAVGLKSRVGLVWGFEIKPGTDGKGHPHLHVMVFSPDSAALESCLEVLAGHWQREFPGARIMPQAIRIMSSAPAEWGPRLHYTLKGTVVDPEWPNEVFEVAVMMLTSGRQHYAAIGLMKSGRRGAALSDCPHVNSIDPSGNSREATK